MLLLERKVNGFRHEDGQRHAIEYRWRVLPLPDCIECCLIEQGIPTQNARVPYATARVDRYFDNYVSLYTCRLRVRRVHRWDVASPGRRLDVPACTDRRRLRCRGTRED